MSYLTDEGIQNRVQEHYEELKKIVPEERIVGIFLQGSQNYGLGYEGSDVDTKAIVLPEFTDFVLSKKPISTTHVLENGEHIDIKDIRVMFENIKKQNINFVEILFTKYRLLNPMYETLFSPVLDIREEVGRYNIDAALNCIYGQVKQRYKELFAAGESNASLIEKYGYDGKKLDVMCRMEDFMENYIDGQSYASCLDVYDKTWHILIKKNEYYTLEEAKYYAESILKSTKQMKDRYMAENENQINIHVEEVMNQILFDLLSENFKNEIEKHKAKTN